MIRLRRAMAVGCPVTQSPTRCRLSCLQKHTHTHTHMHLMHSSLSRTTWISRYQKGKTNLDFTEARDSEWQWHQLGRMQVCNSVQTTTPAPHHSVFYRPDALPAAQPTASKHWRQTYTRVVTILEKLHAFIINNNKQSSDALNWARDDGGLGRHWHQLDHMQTICTSIRTDNHTNTSSLNFYRPNALPAAQPTASKHRR